MTDSTPPPPIPWRIVLEVMVRDGYRCRGCKRVVLADDERRIVVVNRHHLPEAHNVLTLCERCAEMHEAGK